MNPFFAIFGYFREKQNIFCSDWIIPTKNKLFFAENMIFRKKN